MNTITFDVYPGFRGLFRAALAGLHVGASESRWPADCETGVDQTRTPFGLTLMYVL